jgi:hypothetical protein
MGRKLDSGGEAPIHIAFATESHRPKPPRDARPSKTVLVACEREQSFADPVSEPQVRANNSQ